MSGAFLSRFTPSLLSPETLEALLVQREQLASNLVDRIRLSILTQNKHYSLIIGPRGIGKTHLVSLVYYRVQRDDELSDHLICAWLREEEWGITSFLDLLISILRTLSQDLEDPKIESEYQSLFELPPEKAELAAEQLLLEIIGDRTLLVIVENLDEVFEGMGEEGQQKLRAYIQNHPCWTILGTSQSLFNGVSLRDSPFYGFFEVSHLKELSFNDAVALLIKIAQHHEDQDLARDLQTTSGRSRIRAVHHLAAGNPRVYVILSQFLTSSALDHLVEPLMQTLDDLTPYYQARMSYLSPQQRKLVEFLCERRGAVSVKEIAKHNFITHPTTSSQLKKLRQLGYVRPARVGKESFFELREPLMRLSLEVKRQRGEPIRLLVAFLRMWFFQEELRESLAPSSTSTWSLAGACHYQRGQLEDSLESLDRALAIAPENPEDLSNRAIALSSLGRHEEALAAFDRAIGFLEGASSFHVESNRAVTLMLLGRWEDGRQALDGALASFSEGEIKEDGGEIAIVRNMLIRTQREETWRRHIAVWIELFERHDRLTLLGQGLVRTIQTLTIPWITTDMARAWSSVWQDLGADKPGLTISLRLFDAAVHYRESGDERVLLALPAEERALLEPLLEAGQN